MQPVQLPSQIESLETRLNLSTLGMAPTSDGTSHAVTAAVSRMGQSRVLSLVGAAPSKSSYVAPLASVGTFTLLKNPAAETAESAPQQKLNRPRRALVTKDATVPVVIPPQPAPSTTTTTTTLDNTGDTVVLPTDTTTTTVDPLAGYVSQLFADGVHDDSKTIQSMVDAAYSQGLSTVTLPAGQFLLNKDIWLYGNGVTLKGQGAATVLVINNNHTNITSGTAIIARPEFTNPIYNIAQAPTANSLILRGNISLQVGERLFLTNGIGSALQLEKNLGGVLNDTNLFRERDSIDYVTVASTSLNAAGNTVVQFATPLKNLAEYFNVAPNGKSGESYLHIRRLNKAADNLTIADLAIKFQNMKADVAIMSHYTDGLNIRNVSVLNKPTNGGPGEILIVGSTHATLTGISIPHSDIGLNSARYVLVTGCTLASSYAEEGVTDSVIQNNTFLNAGTIAFRVNDMLCARITFSGNSLVGGPKDVGSIGVWEGTDITLSDNTVSNTDVSLIWLGRTKGVKVLNNIAKTFGDYSKTSGAVVTGNSWQK